MKIGKGGMLSVPIVKLLTWLYKLSRMIREILGWGFLCILAAYSIAYLKGDMPSEARLNLMPLFADSSYVYIWLGALAVSIGGMAVEIVNFIKSKFGERAGKAEAAKGG